MDDISQPASDDVALFMQRLDQFPEAGKSIYQIAFDIIDYHLQNDQASQASDVLSWLQRIEPRIQDPEIKEWVAENLTLFADEVRKAQLDR